MTRRHLLVALLCLAWILPGLIGHDPWKPDEAYTFGIVYDIVNGGSWLATSLAGEPYLKEPPLYYLTAAATAKLFSPVLPLHDGARMATAFYMALTFLFCALAWRELAPDGSGTLAAMLLLGTFGLVVRAHQLIPDVAGLAGFAMVYYGCTRSLRGTLGGVWLGTGVGVVFLSLGTPESIMAALIALILPLVSSAWRTRTYAKALGLALITMLPWVSIWPFALYTHSPQMFAEWQRTDSIRQLARTAGSGFYYLRILPWYAWPLWPLALWSLWRAFGAGPAKPSTVLPLTGLLVTLLALTESADKRELYALPLLLPLTLLAAPGAQTLRRGAANAWYWFAIMFFTFWIVVGWVYWSGLELALPPRLHAHLLKLQPGYAAGFKIVPFVIGVAFSAVWIAMLAKVKKGPERAAIVWGTGMTVVWGLAATLFVAYLDTGKSYRGVFHDVRAALPPHHGCVASRNLGEPQRAMLQYFGGVVTVREEASERAQDCDLLLVQGAREEKPPGDGWTRIWEGNRPGDRGERYRLYRRHAVR